MHSITYHRNSDREFNLYISEILASACQFILPHTVRQFLFPQNGVPLHSCLNEDIWQSWTRFGEILVKTIFFITELKSLDDWLIETHPAMCEQHHSIPMKRYFWARQSELVTERCVQAFMCRGRRKKSYIFFGQGQRNVRPLNWTPSRTLSFYSRLYTVFFVACSK